MKKIYFSLMTIAALLFTACNSDEGPGNVENTGAAMVTTITFDSGINDEIPAPKAATTSNAIPITNWDNVKQLQLFLYNATDGTVAYSAILDRSDFPATSATTSKEFIWTDVPTGTYRLALLANANSNTDSVDTYVNDAKQVFNTTNVLNKKFQTSFTTPATGTGLQIDLKQFGTLPSTPLWAANCKRYAIPSEIFTAYKDTVEIVEGAITSVSGALKLQREVSMMRTRFNITELKKIQEDLGTVLVPTPIPTPKALFDNGANNFIAVRRLPVGFGLKVGTGPTAFAGGVFNTSDNDRVMIASSGAGTFKNANPSTGYNPTKILDPLDTKFTLWHDIMVLPNMAQGETPQFPATPNNAHTDRKYFIVVCARAEAGYKYDDGVTIAAAGAPIYWGGLIDGKFNKNTIHELNISFKTAGSPTIPIPKPEGTLDIEIGIPQDWVLAAESYEKDL